jgi:hypothetical protein
VVLTVLPFYVSTDLQAIAYMLWSVPLASLLVALAWRRAPAVLPRVHASSSISSRAATAALPSSR